LNCDTGISASKTTFMFTRRVGADIVIYSP